MVQNYSKKKSFSQKFMIVKLQRMFFKKPLLK
jgi:hypothetical protein